MRPATRRNKRYRRRASDRLPVRLSCDPYCRQGSPWTTSRSRSSSTGSKWIPPPPSSQVGRPSTLRATPSFRVSSPRLVELRRRALGVGPLPELEVARDLPSRYGGPSSLPKRWIRWTVVASLVRRPWTFRKMEWRRENLNRPGLRAHRWPEERAEIERPSSDRCAEGSETAPGLRSRVRRTRPSGEGIE